MSHDMTIEKHSTLPGLIDRATSALINARTSAEILESRDLAAFAYDVAKRAARMGKAKQAHDELIAAAHRAQADALEIEALAKRRLADEYDAAQQRGDVKKAGNPNCSSSEQLPGPTNLGLSRKDIHEARLVRDAEEADPGIVRRTLDVKLQAGDEPTKAVLRKMVVDASLRGLRGGGRRKRSRNPVFDPDPAFDAIAGIDGCCRRITELFETHGTQFILSGCVDEAMRKRSIATMAHGRDVLTQILEENDVN